MTSRPIISPPALRPGDCIGVFTPSAPLHVRCPDRFEHGLTQLRVAGYRVVEGELTGSRTAQGYRSGPPEARAAEFMDLILDPTVDGLIACIGGSNSSSMIPYLDFDAIRANAKVVCGSSDVTSLHMAILARSGVSTFFGPAVMPAWGEWPTVISETLESFQAAVGGDRNERRELPAPSRWTRKGPDWATDAWKVERTDWNYDAGWTTLNPGSATAPIIVANLNTLCGLMGTPYLPDFGGVILLLETMMLDMGREERQLRQLQLAGVFEDLRGLLIGRVEFPAIDPALSLHELYAEVLGPRAYPIVGDVDCCHTKPMLTIAQHSTVTIEAPAGRAPRLFVEAAG